MTAGPASARSGAGSDAAAARRRTARSVVLRVGTVLVLGALLGLPGWIGGRGPDRDDAVTPRRLEGAVPAGEFIEERSIVTVVVDRPVTLRELLHRYRLALSRSTVARLNPHLSEADLAGVLEPGIEIALFVQADRSREHERAPEE